MGSSGKKHKKEREPSTRKRRHHRSKSRSRSPLSSDKEKDRKHRRHHKERKRERPDKPQENESEDSDCVEVPPAPQISIREPPTQPKRARTKSPERHTESAGKGDSISIEETNKLRAKLGLKPLDTGENSAPADDGKLKDDLGEFYHAPAININKLKKKQKIKDKLTERKEKRALEQKLASIKGLGESDSDDDAAIWVQKNRDLQKQKADADKRAKLLEEMDEEFGVGDLVTEEFQSEKRFAYNARHLKGLRVDHNVDHFKEGSNVILTLKDQEVLDEAPDALVNVNMIDDERYIKSNENKKQKPGLHGYDVYNEQESEKTLLSKYDEVIGDEAKTTFSIGDNQDVKRKLLLIQAKLSNKRLESLDLPAPKLASEYFTAEEIEFKKPKNKVRKIRQKPKMLKADDLLSMNNGIPIETSKDLGTRKKRKRELDIMDSDDMLPSIENEDIKVEPEVDHELEAALSKARRLKAKEVIKLEPMKVKLEDPDDLQLEGTIVLNSTAEFCRSLGDIPTYGLAGNRDEEPDIMDFEPTETLVPSAESGIEGSWNTIMETGDPSSSSKTSAPILEDEPSIGSGVGGALKLAVSKGYLEKEDQNRPSSTRFAHLQAQNYSIEDKSHGGEDEKFGGRRERYAGPTTDFREKDGFKPNVKLDYIDDDGHVLTSKEAFRYLSHKFHGKGPGKNKVEKRLKKNEQEGLMKKMSSTDTPLGTLGMLQAKQRETHSAYVVLSGNKQAQNTTISKNKR